MKGANQHNKLLTGHSVPIVWMKLKTLSMVPLQGERECIRNSDYILFEILFWSPWNPPARQLSASGLDWGNSAKLTTLEFLIYVMVLINVMLLNEESYHHNFSCTVIYFLIREWWMEIFPTTNKRAARLLSFDRFFLPTCSY